MRECYPRNIAGTYREDLTAKEICQEGFPFRLERCQGEREQLHQTETCRMLDEKKHEMELKEGTTRALMLTLIQSGKGPAEINEYLTMLNYKF